MMMMMMTASCLLHRYLVLCFTFEAHVLWTYFEEHGVSLEDIDREKNSSVCHHHRLDMDTARVTFVSKVQLEKLDVLSQSSNCWEVIYFSVFSSFSLLCYISNAHFSQYSCLDFSD